MKFRVEFTSRALRDLRGFESQVRIRIGREIDLLEVEPRPRGCQMLKGEKGLYRVRVGDYRVVYEIHDKVLVVLVIRIGHRKDIYQ